MTDEAPVRPSTETNVLLGRLEAKVDNLTEEQRFSRTEFASVRTELAEVKADVAVLKSKQGGLRSGLTVATALVAVAAFTLTILDRLYT